MKININVTATVQRRVHILWPAPDTRVPADQRPKPNIDGHLDCEYRFLPTEDVEALDAQVASGEITSVQRLEHLVPTIDGLPLEGDETAFDFIRRHPYGSVFAAAILEDYIVYQQEGRAKNSSRRRSR